MRIPFDKYKNLPLSLNDGVDKCHGGKCTKSAVFGLNDAKCKLCKW